jgi:dolichol-phosphate mannosyltransferase
MKKNNKNIAVIIPSFNEVKNIEILIKGINRELPDTKIIIVDDSSKKENLSLRQIVKNKKNVILISRLKKGGRGSAVLDGFKEALRDKKIEYAFEMDSDLAHDPKEMKRFIKKKNDRRSYDFIIGSRYLPGGKIINIAANRTIMSRVINKFLYYWLGIHLSDHTSGFRLYKRKCIEFLINAKLKAKGFIALSESAYKLHLANFKAGEVPITWNYRKYGKSTVNASELFNSLTFVIIMKLKYLYTKYWKILFSIIAIFILALSFRITTLNQIGRTWDEQLYVEVGYKMDELLVKGDFANSFFYTTYDHPPFAKYLYGITAHLDKTGIDNSGNPIFNYDYTYSRILSAIFGSLSAVLVLLIAWEFIAPFAGIVSGIIFSLLPFFIGLSQLVSTESILMFLFTSSVYSFIKLLQKFSLKKIIITGVLTGLALGVKQSNALLFPIFSFIFLSWFVKYGKLKEKLYGRKFLSLFTIGIISVVTFVVIWPMPYFHLDVINSINQKIWLVKTSPPIIFWGKLMLSPVIYFTTMFFITTPLLVVLLFLIGLIKIQKINSWIVYGILFWFIIPFLQSFYVWRVHGLRYIIEIYAPLSIIAAAGVYYIIEKINAGLRVKILSIVLIFLYFISILFPLKPYYLDYFNELVGGTKGVYVNKYFELGWWGQGLGEAGRYLENNAKANSSIALFISPPHVFPPVKNQKLVFIDPNNGIYNSKIKYDYVVVNYFHVLREGFNDSGIKNDYKLIHQVVAGDAPIVDIYQKK